MKKLLEGLYLALGTLFIFGLPSAVLGFSALFGEQVMKLLHTSLGTMNSLSFQLEALAIVFGTSAGGLATALAVFALVWMLARAVQRAAKHAEPLAVAPQPRLRAQAEGPAVGRIDHSGTHRRARTAA